MIVVDTSVLIDHLRRRDAALALLDGAFERGEGVLASEVTRIELLAGMRSHERRSTRALLGVLDWEPVDRRVADAAGAYARRFHRSHTGIDLADYVIAATATLHGAELWTRNVRHFPMFPELEPPY